MSLYKELLQGNKTLALIGLGYVGMPLAVAFSKKVPTIGYDLNPAKIKQYKEGIDPTGEVGNDGIASSAVCFTSDENDLDKASFFIVAVPTPVNLDHSPDLQPIESASRIVGRHLTPGSIVVYESTVYPGVTEDICVPILEDVSGLKCGQDFKIGYSPERINPGDKEHRLESIVKIVSGCDEDALNQIARTYELIIDAGVHYAESIKVAEAAKVIENSQRDINIAFMNELSIIFHKMGIDTLDVLRAAETKWNFLPFRPGLVGGHCIGVDPYYLTQRAEELGYHSQVILSGRRINDSMGDYVAQNLVKRLIAAGVSVKRARVAIYGYTFKEDCPDVRNSKVDDIFRELLEYGIEPFVFDPVADEEDVKRLYGVTLAKEDELNNLDAIVIATAHQKFKDFSPELLIDKYGESSRILFDVKGALNRDLFVTEGFDYWRL